LNFSPGKLSHFSIISWTSCALMFFLNQKGLGGKSSVGLFYWLNTLSFELFG
jgi:hypothetical protein